MNQVVKGSETIFLDNCRGLDQFPAMHARLDGFRDVVEGLLSSPMKVFVQLRRLGLDSKATQYLAGIVPPRRGQFAEHKVTGLNGAPRMILPRYAAVRRRHWCGAYEV